MTRTIYLDTNIYMDLLLERRGAKIAFDILFRRTPRCEFKIVVSDWLIRELELNGLGSDNLRILFSRISDSGKMVKVYKTPEDVEEAKKISEHFQDPLHAILAKKGGAEVLVTRNIQDFASCRHLLEIKFPEDI